MQHTRLLFALVAGLAIAGLNAPAAQAAEEDPGRSDRRQKMLERFDTDGDGQLSEQERQAAREARGGKGSGNREARRQRMLEKYDTDGDGKLNREERTAAREARGDRGGPRRGPGRGRPGGPPGPPPGPLGEALENPERFFRSHDTDSDGSLSMAEFQAMVEKIREFGPPPPPPRPRGPRGPRDDRRPGPPPAPELE